MRGMHTPEPVGRFIRRRCAWITAVILSLIVAGGVLAASEVHWSYEGDTGPEHWGELSPDFAACAQGVEQSPVDIPASAPVNPANIGFKYQPSAVNIFNNGHTVQVNYDQGSSIVLTAPPTTWCSFTFTPPASMRSAARRIRWSCTSCIRTPRAAWLWLVFC